MKKHRRIEEEKRVSEHQMSNQDDQQSFQHDPSHSEDNLFLKKSSSAMCSPSEFKPMN